MLNNINIIYTFCYNAGLIWNSIPKEIGLTPCIYCISHFKSKLNSYIFSNHAL